MSTVELNNRKNFEHISLTPTDTPATSEDPYSAHLQQSFVPIATRSMTEQEAVHQSVQERQLSPSTSSSPATMMWPSIGGVPINEFTTEGYFSCAFPTLFPTGAGDFSGQRQNQVTIGNYFKHLMMYDDNRFAKHPRFRFFALNTEMRWRALQTGRMYVKQHPGHAQLSLDELRDMVGREGQTFSNRVHSIREYQNSPNSNLLFTKVSMHLSISHSLCSAVHNYDSLCRRSSRSPIMLSILLVLIIPKIYPIWPSIYRARDSAAGVHKYSWSSLTLALKIDFIV